MEGSLNLYETDPEFMERYEVFVSQDVMNEPGLELDDDTRIIAILASLIGSQGLAEYKILLDQVLENSISPIRVKEITYQAVAYLGFGRVRPFLLATNQIMSKKGIELPLARQATTTIDDRLEKGIEAQVAIFGEGMREFWKGGHINRWLASNCFGDYYTRTGLDLKQRELITFCFLAAHGGCETQLTSHVVGNIRIGNDKEFLAKVISHCLPYIGYPRSLNALGCISKATEL